jgi:hypothetical protein
MALTDGDQIRGLLGRYCQLIDSGDFVGIGSLMADAVLMTDDGTTIATGADEVAALYAGLVQLHDDGTPGTQHVVANTVLEELEDGAIRARSAYLVFQAVPELPLQPIITGSYTDTFDKGTFDQGSHDKDSHDKDSHVKDSHDKDSHDKDRAGRWRFVERRFGIGRSGDLTHHLDPGVIR